MGLISTKELFDRYFADLEGTTKALTRANIDKPEVYAYEQKIGKELIDMDVDDLFGLINELKQKRKGQEISYMISYASYDQTATILRSIFEWYIDNITPIKNPLNDKRMKGSAAVARLAKDREPFRWSVVEEVIRNLHHDKDEDNADYIELILLLFYCGFSKAEEIVQMKAEMINHRNHTVRVSGRTIWLSERCYLLLEKFNNLQEVPAWRGKFAVVSWHNSYFKFLVRPSNESSIDKRPMSSMCDIINRAIATNVNDAYGVKINYNILYYLGFYDFLVSKYGEDATDNMLISVRDSDAVQCLMNAAEEYGIDVNNISHLKRNMRPFVRAK